MILTDADLDRLDTITLEMREFEASSGAPEGSVCALIAEVRRWRAEGAWRPIEEHDPADDDWVLATLGKVPFVAAYDDRDQTWTTFNHYYETGVGREFKPTHFRSLPSPPRSEP